MKCILPLKQPQTSLTTDFTTTSATKSSPKLKDTETTPKPSPNENYPKNTTPTTTTTTTLTKIAALMNIDTSLLPRFHMWTKHSSFITLTLSSSISPSPIFLCMLQKLQQLGLSALGGAPTILTTRAQKSNHHLAI